ncbi:AraC-like ligand-binding domain-containing protein [Micromonospora parathelypteridis]|uniref:AraC-like DNA-binding protein n=1 Tax=Micromonospora parathelypteridis TaxID=1839617 RepID=A0A840W2T1_9ACTN|nr:helix-turn-helix domain-containing protein [Micromonospora parathelypteridis]MBB5480364.1 AraC-like DNA-binding protein [Micromonospora parathelypteridis]GGO23763.1 AraC family transcriptional regulator [Micromonospora parathelypteridis]
MLHRETLDTTLLPPSERFGMWLDLVARTSAPMRVRSAHDHDFVARADFVDLGPIQLISYDYPSLEATRTPKLIRQSDPELYMLALTICGVGTSSQDGRQSEIRAGEFTFYDHSRPHDLGHHATEPEKDQATSIVMMIPHAALPLPPQRMAALYGGRMSGSEGIGALLAQFLLQVTRHPEQYHAADASRLGAVGLDLATTMLGRHLVAEDAVPTEVRRRALLAQVQAYVHRHLGDTTLSPQVVADAHHISVRSLHRLFEAEDITVASYIRDLRLTRCRRDLSDHALRNQPVQTIAARWGFSDKAHFSRVFRAAYGMSPQEHREGSSHPARIVNRAASMVNSLPAD